jgi:hypothetical protein
LPLLADPESRAVVISQWSKGRWNPLSGSLGTAFVNPMQEKVAGESITRSMANQPESGREPIHE